MAKTAAERRKAAAEKKAAAEEKKATQDTIAKQNAWQAIYDEIGPTEFRSKAESYSNIWVNLWSQYLAFKNKAEGRTAQAGGLRPSFRHEMSMQFFDDKEFDEKSVSNVELGDDSVENITVVEFDQSLNITSITTAEDASNSKENTELPAGPSTTQTEPISESFQSRKHAKNRVALDEFETQVVKAFESNELVDEYDLLGKNVAAKLRKIALKDQYAALDLQYTIFTAMTDTEKQLIKY